RRMGAALGVSPALISRGGNDQQGAGADLLAALARLPGLKPAWLFEGVGEPLLPATKGTPPVARAVLPGPPDPCPRRLARGRHRVPVVFETPSRYWLPVLVGSSLCGQKDLALVPGDLLMFDVNSELWTHNLRAFAGKLFGVRRRRGASCSYEVGQLQDVDARG